MLFTRIVTTVRDVKMPPEESGKSLTPDQVEVFGRGIVAGGNHARMTAKGVTPSRLLFARRWCAVWPAVVKWGLFLLGV